MGDSKDESPPTANLFKPTPSIGIVKFWQGIVEIVLRGASLVLTLMLCIIALITISSINHLAGGIAVRIRITVGWLILVTIITMIIESLILVGRFLNFDFAVTYASIVYMADICVSFAIAVAILCGAIPMAVYSAWWFQIDQQAAVIASSRATAAFGFFTLFAFVGLAVWMIVSLVLKWRNVSNTFQH